MAESTVLRHLLTALGPGADVPADAELLARWVANRDGGSFELLVWRHTMIVLRVCRTVLRDEHLAEDAAQATFLALARQAGSLRRNGSVAGWLFRVARRIAARAVRVQRSLAVTGQSLDREPAAKPVSAIDEDLDRVLHEELARLPEAYRAPVLLCYFSGQTHAEAAQGLGWPVGTVAGRLARAKQILAARLTRRGVGLAILTASPGVVASSGFASSTARAALAFVKRAETGLPCITLELANREVRSMATVKLLRAFAVLFTFGAIALGISWAATSESPPPIAKPVTAAAPISEATAPEVPKAVIAKTYAVAPITTDLQRRLIHHGGKGSSAIVFVDGVKLFREQNVIDLDALDLNGIRVTLKSFSPGADRTVHLLTNYGQGQELHREGTELLRYGLEGLGRQAGYGQAYAAERHGFDKWDDWIAPLKDQTEIDAEEKAVGDNRVRAFPVRTPLSRMLTRSAMQTGATEGVIEICVPLNPGKEDWIPADVEKSLGAAIIALKLPKDGVVNFLLNIDRRAIGNDPVKRDEARIRMEKQVRQWATDHELKYGSVTY